MKVNLAAQTFSRSMAKALEFVSKDLPKFSDVSATTEFIGIVDRLFDTLNSKNPFPKELKSVMRKTMSTFGAHFFWISFTIYWGCIL